MQVGSKLIYLFPFATQPRKYDLRLLKICGIKCQGLPWLCRGLQHSTHTKAQQSFARHHFIASPFHHYLASIILSITTKHSPPLQCTGARDGVPGQTHMWLTRDRYTHYFEILNLDCKLWIEFAWPQLIHDVPIILRFANVRLEGRRSGDGRVSPTVNIHDGIYLNETAEAHQALVIHPKGHHSGRCCTMLEQYDVAVACILLRAYMLAPDNFRLS